MDYTLRRLTGPNRERFTPFVYAGAGMCWFNPQALYEGQWVELQPLGTEGQGLPQYPDRQPYAKYTFVFPFGGGHQVSYQKQLGIWHGNSQPAILVRLYG